MAIASNNNKALGPWTSVPFSPKLVYYYNGTKWYYPLITPTSTLTWDGYVYSYDRSVGDTFGVALNNTKYVVPNKKVAAYDIAPGTYTPSAFKKLVTSFIGSTSGSYRTLANAVSVTVNGQTISLSSGTKIYFLIEGSSPWAAAAIGFGVTHIESAACMSGIGFTNYKVYVVELAGSIYNVINDYCYNKVFATYDAYNITVSSPGIKFK